MLFRAFPTVFTATLGAALTVLLGACLPASSSSSPPADGAPSAAAPTSVPTPAVRSGSEREVLLATTTSTRDSGLLDVLVPMFEHATGYRVKTVSVGTGAALALGARGEADVVLVHAPESERRWMAEGHGTRRLLVMHNDYVLVGPPGDPARLSAAADAVAALRAIAEATAPFVSRGDQSGTHQLELALWQQALVQPAGQPWYVESGSGMGQTLTIADQRDAYTIADRATWLAFREKTRLVLLFEGDPALFNVYHVMPVNPAKLPRAAINAAGGEAFADFLVSAEAQRAIGEFGRDRYGQALFTPDAGKGEDELVR